jgi:hypothetical protein
MFKTLIQKDFPFKKKLNSQHLTIIQLPSNLKKNLLCLTMAMKKFLKIVVKLALKRQKYANFPIKKNKITKHHIIVFCEINYLEFQVKNIIRLIFLS